MISLEDITVDMNKCFFFIFYDTVLRGEALATVYPKMIHFACVEKVVRSCCPKVYLLSFSISLPLKAPTRVYLFKEM